MKFPAIEKLIQDINSSTTIDIADWENFKLIELFPDYSHGSRLKKSDRKPGKIPLVTAGQYNNGISEYVTPPDKNEIYCNCISIDMFGNCFYHDYEFVCDDNVYPISGIINKEVGLFLCAVIHNEINYSFKKQFREKELKNCVIKLPVNKKLPGWEENKTPYWEYMENYIISLRDNLMKKLT